MSVVVTDPMDRLYVQNSKMIELLGEILSEIKQSEPSYPITQETSVNGLKVYKKGYMIWWSKHPDAASYRLTLFVGKSEFFRQEIDVIEIERNRAYHAFSDLIGTNMYTVRLDAENRFGKTIDFVEIVL